jgi:uncharacterized protein YndB with AHSA1/START domain
MPGSDFLEMNIDIAARPTTVFGFFIDAERFRRWMGSASEISAEPGGALRVSYPQSGAAVGEVVELVPDERVVFTWGYQDGANGIAPGATRVTVDLRATNGGTRATLRHEGLETAEQRSGHSAGWRHLLAQLALAASREAIGNDLEANVDAYVDAWNETDPAQRNGYLLACWAEDGVFKDAVSYVAGRAALDEHIANAQAYLRGARLTRRGPVQLCHDRVRFGWRIIGPDGAPFAQGTNYGEVSADGKITCMVGFGITVKTAIH